MLLKPLNPVFLQASLVCGQKTAAYADFHPSIAFPLPRPESQVVMVLRTSEKHCSVDTQPGGLQICTPATRADSPSGLEQVPGALTSCCWPANFRQHWAPAATPHPSVLAFCFSSRAGERQETTSGGREVGLLGSESPVQGSDDHQEQEEELQKGLAGGRVCSDPLGL